MKKIFIAMAAIVCSMSVNAQTMKVMKGDEVVATYTAEQADKVVFEESTAPAGDANLLPGVFTVNADGKTVQFTKGNLYCNTTTSPVTYGFEAKQYDYQTSWDANHVGHFYWSSSAAVAYAQDYSDASASTSDKFFCGEDNKITVEGTEGLYALSSDEWSYLISTRTDATNLRKYGQTVGEETNCLLIAPDGFDTSKWHSSNSYTLEEVNSLGLVCLPAAGYRNGSDLYYGGDYGFCWSSSPSASYAYGAYFLDFGSDYVDPASGNYRYIGYSLRLVK